MLKKIKQLTVTFIAALSLAVPMMMPAMVHADSITDGVCSGVNTATGDAAGTSCTDASANGDTKISSVIKSIINIFSLIIGAVAVIMIIYGGFKYITSGGNDGNVSGAKNTILYAVIGLVIVALAQVIVRFVLTKASV